MAATEGRSAREGPDARPAPRGGGETLSIPEAARLLGVGETTLYRAARAGEFPAERRGARWVVPLRVVERLLEAGWRPGGPEGPARGGLPPVTKRRTARRPLQEAARLLAEADEAEEGVGPGSRP